MTTAMDDATAPTSRRSWMLSRAAQAAGIPTTAIAGGLSMMITAPQAAADTSAADSSLQPAINNLLDAMQQAVAQDEALPFATPDSDAMLLSDLQNTNYELLERGAGRPHRIAQPMSAGS